MKITKEILNKHFEFEDGCWYLTYKIKSQGEYIEREFAIDTQDEKTWYVYVGWTQIATVTTMEEIEEIWKALTGKEL